MRVYGNAGREELEPRISAGRAVRLWLGLAAALWLVISAVTAAVMFVFR
jgi:hypothetical protein